MQLGGVGSLTVVVLFATAFAPSAAAQLETRSTTPLSAEARYAAVGDFNSDGRLDVAMADTFLTNNIAVLLGNGDGTFGEPTYYTVGDEPPSMVVASDLRNNGRLDLIVGESLTSNLYVLLGNGDGTFEPAASLPTLGWPFFAGTGDFNNDGITDIWALTNEYESCGCIEILLGNGDGTFGAPIITVLATSGFSAAVGDFNNDGKLDIVVGEAFGAVTQMQVLLGNGDGTFRHGAIYATDGLASNIVADRFVSGNKNLDLALSAGGTVIYLGNGDGTFTDIGTTPTGGCCLVSADMNGDGIPDLISLVKIGNYLSISLGNGDGTFRAGDAFPLGGLCVNPAVGDFNGDGKIDVAVPNNSGDSVITLLNTGSVTFSPTYPLKFGDQAVGTASAPQKAMLTNTGTTALNIGSVNVSSEFRLDSTNCHRQVAAGGKCSISMVFAPQSKGSKSGTLSIDDSASSKPQVIELSGTGK